jgi:hypothetical protein
MRNPWHDLPKKPPFILKVDEEYIKAHNDLYRQISRETEKRNERLGKAKSEKRNTTYEKVRIHDTAIPEPFAGRRNAPVVILLANPKAELSPDKRPNSEQTEIIRAGLVSPNGQHFFAITDAFKGTGAYGWWQPKLTQLCDEVGFDAVVNNIQVIELHGYHSLEFVSPMKEFPSQEYQFYLVRKAIKRGALIVIPWTVKYWQASVPELMDKKKLAKTGADVVLGRPPYRQAGITETLLEDGGYKKVVRKLRSVEQS